MASKVGLGSPACPDIILRIGIPRATAPATESRSLLCFRAFILFYLSILVKFINV
jgi:hypothetical protein